MATVRPLRAWRVAPEHASAVASVPYDVVDRDEARALAAGNGISFLHVTKPEIDLGDDVAPDAPEVYAQGARALRRLQQDGILVREAAPCMYAYALTSGSHRQVGVVLAASVSDYEAGIVRKHETTRPDKETDRIRHMEAVNAHTGKIFLVHRPHAGIAAVLADVTQTAACIDFTASDHVGHRVWRIDDAGHIRTLVDSFAEGGTLYIADGHHRAAAAARVATMHHAHNRVGVASEGILAVAFASDQVKILPYHRVIKDLAGQTPERLLLSLSDHFDVQPGQRPSSPGHFGMYLAGAWYTLRTRARRSSTDITQMLDVSVLQDRVLVPLLHITDPRRDDRIDFVGGARGLDELERRVHSGWAVAFSLHPTPVGDLLAIADAGAMMPPKSTWFEPKLRDGLVVNSFTA